jgi:glycosyltransferase involved in cell wall biosynthesis
MMKVGVIIGTYNNVSYIFDTIKSVKGQHFNNWSCIIIDNGSIDDTVSIIKHSIENDSRFQFFQKDNEGPSAGRNYGYSKLPEDVEYVHFLDGDDLLKPDFLNQMVLYLEDNKDVGLLGCQYDVIDENGAYVGPGYRSRFAPNSFGFPRKLTDSEFNTPFETFFSATGQGPFGLFRNSIFKLTSGYEIDFWSHEDSDIFCQMGLIAKVHYIPTRLYQKRVHADNLTFSPRASYEKFRNKWDLYVSDNRQVNDRIEKALKYYYGIHAPLRHFKIFIMASKEFAYKRERSKFNWMLKLFKDGVNDLFLKKALKARLSERKQFLSVSS